MSHLEEVFALVEKWSIKHEKWDVYEQLNAINVPCGPILDTEDLVTDQSLRKSGMIVEVDHPERGTYLTVGCPLRLSDSPVEIERSPLLGEHSGEVLTSVLTLEGEEVERLRGDGVI